MGRLSKLKDAIDKSLTARRQRAAEIGHFTNMPLYHGTGQDVTQFDLSLGGQTTNSPVGSLGVSAATDPETASEFARLASARLGDNSSANVMPLYHRAENPASITLAGDETDSEVAATVLQAWDDGFDSILFNNYTTPEGQTSRSFVLVKDPNQLRSVNAAFDPAKKDSANLMAGIGGAAVLGGAAGEDAEAGMSPEQAEAVAMQIKHEEIQGRKRAARLRYNDARARRKQIREQLLHPTGYDSQQFLDNPFQNAIPVEGNPALIEAAGTLRDYTESPLGGSWAEGVAGLLEKHGQGQQRDYLDYFGAAADFF